MVTLRANINGPLNRGMVVLQFVSGSFHIKKLCSRLYSIKVDFYLENKVAFKPPFGGLKVTYARHLYLIGQPVIDFLFVDIELFC